MKNIRQLENLSGREGWLAPGSSIGSKITLELTLMAQKWSNQNIPGALHFVTGNVINRIAVFEQESICRAFLDVCGDLRRDWPAKLVAYVLMPDHFHLIANPVNGDIRGFSGALKSLSARRIIEIICDRRFLRKEPEVDGQSIRCGRRVSKQCRCGALG